jgi:hypothetical protein
MAARTAEATHNVAGGVWSAGRARPQTSVAEAEAIDWLARLLLVAVVLDLVVTRFVVRLAIFVPKGEPLSTLSAALGRLGAAADAFVPLAGLLLLGALLVRSGRTGRRGEAAVLIAVVVVATGGFALIHLPPRPAVMLVLDSLVVAIALASALRVRDTRGPVVAHIGFVALAAAIAFAAIGHAVDLSGVIAGSSDGEPSGPFVLAIISVGQFTFVGGAALLGLGGVVGLRKPGPGRGRLIGIGLASTLVVLVAAARAPAIWGALAIWSIGLAGAVPVPVVAVALGLAVAGLPVLHRRAPAMAIGASIVLVSGYDLAASGLVLAGLLGLVVGSMDGPDPGIVPGQNPVS